jgi:hypothetical protein
MRTADMMGVAEWLERFQDLGEREAVAFRRRRPLVHRRAVRHVEGGEARLRARGSAPQRRLRRDHRVEEWQCDDGADTPKKRSPREM